MRIIFMGTPEFAVPSLEALVAAGHEVCAVYAQPPRPANRGKKLTPSAVQVRAEALGLAVRAPLSLKGADEQAAFAALNADIAVVAAYGLILPQAILDAPTHGCLNVHGSLLPRWRGAAPVQRAILAGDEDTGVCIMQMEAGLDTGPVRATQSIKITHQTAGHLTTQLAVMGAELAVTVLENLPAYPPVAQVEQGVTYASKIDKAETRIDFTVGAVKVQRQIRAFNPSPAAWFDYHGERIKILNAEVLIAQPNDYHTSFPAEPGLVLGDQLAIGCGDGAIRPTTLQRAGRGAMDTLEFLRGFPIPAGTKL